MIRIYLNGKEVAIILRVRRMSQKELAEKTGMSAVHISRLMNHQSPVGIVAQKKLQNAMRFIPFERMFTVVDRIPKGAE